MTGRDFGALVTWPAREAVTSFDPATGDMVRSYSNPPVAYEEKPGEYVWQAIKNGIYRVLGPEENVKIISDSRDELRVTGSPVPLRREGIQSDDLMVFDGLDVVVAREENPEPQKPEKGGKKGC